MMATLMGNSSWERFMLCHAHLRRELLYYGAHRFCCLKHPAVAELVISDGPDVHKQSHTCSNAFYPSVPQTMYTPSHSQAPDLF